MKQRISVILPTYNRAHLIGETIQSLLEQSRKPAEILGIEKVPPAISLGVTFVILAAGVGYSLWRTRNDAPHAPAALEDANKA